MGKEYPCPECGARKGQAHKTTCRRAQVRRRPGFGKLPRAKQWRYQKHVCVPRVSKTYGDTEYLKCKLCERSMGKRKKK